MWQDKAMQLLRGYVDAGLCPHCQDVSQSQSPDSNKGASKSQAATSQRQPESEGTTKCPAVIVTTNLFVLNEVPAGRGCHR
jgi:hypothetical protein